jgi:hypothetical protein
MPVGAVLASFLEDGGHHASFAKQVRGLVWFAPGLFFESVAGRNRGICHRPGGVRRLPSIVYHVGSELDRSSFKGCLA